MNKLPYFYPIAFELIMQLSMLKTLMYGGVIWGLYHPAKNGWAIKTEQNECLFPFWLTSLQAHSYAQQHWPGYSPRLIRAKDFHQTLLPTLNRLKVMPALFNAHHLKIKLSGLTLQQFFAVPAFYTFTNNSNMALSA